MLRHQRRGDQDISDSRARQMLGFIENGAALADGAGRSLAPRNLGAFVGLGVRAQAETMR